jgi:hypothetical protein
LLVDRHSQYTHSLGAALIVLAVGFIVVRPRSRVAAVFVVGIAAAYGSHVLVDWLTEDTSPPIGIMALWPFSSEYYVSPVSVFGSLARHVWLRRYWWLNTTSLLREWAILVPLALLAWRLRGPGRLQAPPRGSSCHTAPAEATKFSPSPPSPVDDGESPYTSK